MISNLGYTKFMEFKKFLSLIFVLAFNLWIWKIFQFSLLIAILTVATTVLIYLANQLNNKYCFFLSIPLVLLLVIFQYKTTLKTQLIDASNLSKLVQSLSLFNKLGENLSQNIDPSLYFFANHPRERYGVIEFEKFPYILLVAFIIGFVSLKKTDLRIILLALSPIIILTFIGNNNPIGPFSLFPLLVLVTTIGVSKIVSKKLLFLPGLIICILIFIQIISYAKY